MSISGNGTVDGSGTGATNGFGCTLTGWWSSSFTVYSSIYMDDIWTPLNIFGEGVRSITRIDFIYRSSFCAILVLILYNFCPIEIQFAMNRLLLDLSDKLGTYL